MDVDHLKHINDAHGHAAGDEVLSKIAKVAKESSRCCDVLARYGGDEFCMLLPETGVEGAGHVIQRVKDRIAATTLMHMDEPASVSVGVAGVAGKRSPDEVLAAADRALYESKRAGRGQMCIEPEPIRESGQ
jgi:diguanylate cyclase (GGDEF)-like protein